METELEVDDLGGARDADHGLDVTSACAIHETGYGVSHASNIDDSVLDDSSTASESSETSLETSGADDDLGDATDGASILETKRGCAGAEPKSRTRHIGFVPELSTSPKRFKRCHQHSPSEADAELDVAEVGDARNHPIVQK